MGWGFEDRYEREASSRMLATFLDFNIPSSALGHLGTNYTLNILLHQFKTQVTQRSKGLVPVLNNPGGDEEWAGCERGQGTKPNNLSGTLFTNTKTN